MRIHLIAIGGSAMHNIALALQSVGHEVSGSDDEIYEPARSRLADHGLLPTEIGWHPDTISDDIDCIILGMHARSDNPELARALELGLKVYSYPEFLYEFAKDKKRIVIGGSHGKTSTTSMIMHVLKKLDYSFDYLVGAQIPGFEQMVRFSDAPIMVIEGDEYLSSCLDRRPKFLHYKPHIAVLTGISWDHINVFPEFKEYKHQFQLFGDSLEENAHLIYFENDEHIQDIVTKLRPDIQRVSYGVFPGADPRHFSSILHEGVTYELGMFGKHNLENMHAAMLVCKQLGVSIDDFLRTMADFKGAAKRLQQFVKEDDCTVFFDFAHAPSKVKASLQAVKLQFPHLKIRGVFELHTFSSLNKTFLKEYEFAMKEADEAIVFYDQHTLEMKRMDELQKDYILKSFRHDNMKVFTQANELEKYLNESPWRGFCTLFMSSGNFMNLPLKQMAVEKTKPMEII